MLGHTIDTLLLRALSRDPSAPDYAGGTQKTTVDSCLEYLLKTLPDLLDFTSGKDVLDYGCGWGWQAEAIATRGARSVVGYDTDPRWIQKARSERSAPNLSFTTAPPSTQFDVVYSCSSFEHFPEPERELDNMRRLTKPGGVVLISFAEPWWSPRGSHTDNFTRLPWVNLLFQESAVLAVRSLYRDDGAKRYEDVRGGLNRMSVAKFKRIIDNSGMSVERLRTFAVRGLPLVTALPIVRELLTASVSAVLRRTTAG